MFLLGRFLVVAVHETAHGLTMASFGRRVEKAGIKLIAIFPFAFVDTSEAWFEPRRRRIAISAAGPGVGLHARRDLLDLLPRRSRRGPSATSSSSSRSPATSARSSTSTRSSSATATTCSSTGCASRGCGGARAQQFARRLSGSARTDDSPVLARYSLWGLAWSVLAAGVRDRDDAALRAGDDGARAAGGRAYRHGHAVGRRSSCPCSSSSASRCWSAARGRVGS